MAKRLALAALAVLLSLAVAAALAEFTLREMARHQRRAVPDYGDTIRPQGRLGPGGYLKENLNIYVTDGLGGRVRWTNNAAGFRSDREFPQTRPPGVVRILSLGDSFTAGYRVGQEETFSYLQEQWLNRKFGRTEVLVAEIEEPATGFYYLGKFGIRFNPDLVLLGISLGNDIAQSYLALDPRGEYVLRREEGRVSIEPNPREPKLGFKHGLEIYKLPPACLEPRSGLDGFLEQIGWRLKRSYLLRRFFEREEAITSWGERNPPLLFDLNNGFGMFLRPAPPMVAAAYRRLFRILTAFQTFCRQRGIVFAVQLFPQRYQVQPGDWDRAVREYGLKSSCFDLMAPNRRIRDFCRQEAIPCLDATAALAAYCARTGKSLYLPRGDMHWNREGHRAFFLWSREALAPLVQKAFQPARARDSGGRAGLGKIN